MKRICKSAVCAILGGLMLIMFCACYSGEGAEKANMSDNKYAAASLELMLNVCKDYYSLDAHVLKGQPDQSGPSFVWPFGSFLEALGDVYSAFPENETIKTYYVDALNEGLKKYRVNETITTPTGTHENIVYYNSSMGNRADYYYDDNAWICIRLLEAYKTFGDAWYLSEAEELLKFFETGTDDVLGGGVYWDKSFSSKNTCADGPVCIAYLEAYGITKKAEYLDKAESIMSWLNETLRDDDGLYYDNITTGGEVNEWKADYNQGTPLYALCMLYDFTGKEEYREMADRTAAYSLSLAFKVRGVGDDPKVSMNGNPIYKSWCVGWLMRGFREYVIMTGEAGRYFGFMEKVLDETMLTKDENGYYDPYFCSGEWEGESTTEVLQPCGVASVMAICGYYDVMIKPTLSE